jgi:hypothetical protein
MEGTRGGIESARKIFERGARSGRETPGYMVREEWRKRGIG